MATSPRRGVVEIIANAGQRARCGTSAVCFCVKYGGRSSGSASAARMVHRLVDGGVTWGNRQSSERETKKTAKSLAFRRCPVFPVLCNFIRGKEYSGDTNDRDNFHGLTMIRYPSKSMLRGHNWWELVDLEEFIAYPK